MWRIQDQDGTEVCKDRFADRELAEAQLEKFPPFFQQRYQLVYRGGNAWENRVLTEGLLQHDLDGILLPQISIDEYVPSDPNTDNVVLAFFLKGVPEAVLPFKNFCEKCNGVVDVDYGDSETIQNTSIVYIEMDRAKIEIENIRDLLIQVTMLAAFDMDDFTMTFPHTKSKFPFNLGIMAKYFRSRDERENRLAQRKAEKQAQDEAEQERQGGQERANESLVHRLASTKL